MPQASLANRVYETSTTAGAGALTLAGAATPRHRTFLGSLGAAATTFYLASHRTRAEWEAGVGLVNADGTLTRVTVLNNHLGTTATVNFSAGVKDVMQDVPASKMLALDTDSNRLTLPGALAMSGALSGVTTGSFADTVSIATPNRFASPHRVYLMGDSLTGVSGTYGTQLAASLGASWQLVYKGTSGNTTTQMLARFTADVITPGDGEYVVVWGGVNDIAASATSAAIKANLQAMYTAAHVAGLKVIAVTIAPFSGNWVGSDGAGVRAIQDEVNAWIASGAHHVDYVVDAYATLVDPATPYTLLPAYDSGDFLHLSVAGYAAEGSAVYAAATWAALVDVSVTATGDITTAGILSAVDLNLTRSLTVGGHVNVAGGAVFGGSLGVGTLVPRSILELKSALPTLTLTSATTSGFSGIDFRSNNFAEGHIRYQQVDAQMQIAMGRAPAWGGRITFYTDTVERMRIHSTGNVSIGNTNSTHALSVTGTLAASGAVTFSTTLSLGTAVAGTVLTLASGVTAASGTARALRVGSTLTAAANADALIMHVIAPSFVPGAFTGLTATALSIAGFSVAGFTTPGAAVSIDVGAVTGAAGMSTHGIRIAPPTGGDNNYLITHTTPATFSVTAAGLLTATSVYSVGNVGVGVAAHATAALYATATTTGSSSAALFTDPRTNLHTAVAVVKIQNTGDTGVSTLNHNLLDLDYAGQASGVTGTYVRMLTGGTERAGIGLIADALVLTTGTTARLTIAAAGGATFASTLVVTGAFGCNTKTAQTAYASGGALAAYGAGANGFDSGANASALHALVVSIRAALVANGIMS